MTERWVFRISGIVQGVGFRPFLYDLARSGGLAGFVRNDERGVVLEVEGEASILEGLEESIRRMAPRLARIGKIEIERHRPFGYERFDIRASARAGARRASVSPDAAICRDCLREILDPRDRRSLYPFTNCTRCGPRLTIVRDVPYDRPRTTMVSFTMCEACAAEYGDPSSRRFHAQPNACPACGPSLWLEDPRGRRLAGEPTALARRLLREGRILAIKGIGGFHLACDAKNPVAVRELRERKGREHKPFAMMAADVREVERHATLAAEARALLESVESPIVLLPRRSDCALPESIAPGQGSLGFMLPYTPLHHLLFRPSEGEADPPRLLVMTSGNRAEEPIASGNEEARERLGAIADAFLTHDREIEVPCDDSVARVVRRAPLWIRRSRGCAPRPVRLHPPLEEPVLAVGGMLKSAFALGRGEEAIVSHHIGDLDAAESLAYYRRMIEHYLRLFDHEPRRVAHDLHPDYLSTAYAEELAGAEPIAVQHHEAHIAAVLSEHAFEGSAIGVAFDGTGYGRDGTLWGGEFFLFREGEFEREGSLEPIRLPGGEQAIREPWRIAASFLFDRDPSLESLRVVPGLLDAVRPETLGLVAQMLARRIQTPWASGAGRYFDAAGALLLGRARSFYEAQTPMELEALALSASWPDAAREPWPVALRRPRDASAAPPDAPRRFRVGLEDAFEAILEGVRRDGDRRALAARFHRTMAEAIVRGADLLHEETEIRTIALGGGVFQNALLLDLAVDLLEGLGWKVLLPREIPANDGGLCYGQLAAASWKLRRRASNETRKGERAHVPGCADAARRP